MCRKCRDWPKIELRLAKRRVWGQTINQLSHEGRLQDDDMFVALMRLEDPEVLDKLVMPPPSDMDGDKLLECVGIK